MHSFCLEIVRWGLGRAVSFLSDICYPLDMIHPAEHWIRQFGQAGPSVWSLHERGTAADLRRHGDVAGDRHRPRRRRLAAAVVHGLQDRRPGRRSGHLPRPRLHRHLPRRRLPGLLRLVQVQRRTPTSLYTTPVAILVQATNDRFCYAAGWVSWWISCRTRRSLGSWQERRS
jgi:hypothetical protein